MQVPHQLLKASSGEFPGLFEKPAVVNGTNLIDHDVRGLFQARLASGQMNPQNPCLGLDVGRDGADYGRGVDPIEEVGLNDDDGANLAWFRSDIRVQIRCVDAALPDLHGWSLRQFILDLLKAAQDFQRIAGHQGRFPGQGPLEQLSFPELVVEVDGFVQVRIPGPLVPTQDLLGFAEDFVLELQGKDF